MASVAAAPAAAMVSGRHDNELRHDINKLRTFEQQYPQPQGQNNVQVRSTEVPAGYKGEIPTTQDGEHVIWVKKVYTTREYYDPPDEYEPEELNEFGFRKERDVSLYLNRRYP
ncbi:hypothetical protein BCR41DRAFT_393413 [Lobosporangium transversale]|uniref:Uncharacterized protein n=1 Tax=Lobosporangium transversale TaxID=64571 RepID=A0A1Y2GWZ3_9FUNG|nr:hypothetical protein BCR41DRAFT_393413 [Lobosporangium transversale]ORZ26806.1 hypothetical protein BCR41DRAFT_393413 [Lobosporangium transversale]|eukprot:XP_021884569.1 hypothetical protein BCR41DRAFT_393413 [Lobosporangium transversale]